MNPGAFTAVACTDHYHSDRDWRIATQALALPPAVLVHLGHKWTEDPSHDPVAIAIPRRLDDGRVFVDGVFASTAGQAWWQIRSGWRAGVSIVASIVDYIVDDDGQLRATEAVLYGVDLVKYPADHRAWIRDVRPDLTPAEAEVQRRFDAYLNDPVNPRGIDIAAAVATRNNVAALEPLRWVAEGKAPRGAASPRPPCPIVTSAGSPASVPAAPSPGQCPPGQRH